MRKLKDGKYYTLAKIRQITGAEYIYILNDIIELHAPENVLDLIEVAYYNIIGEYTEFGENYYSISFILNEYK